MPLYDYRCTNDNCGHTFDRLMRRHSDPNPPCEMCGTETKRMLGTPALVFKGSGWARDGYAGGKSVDEARRAINDMSRMKGVSDDRLRSREAQARGGSGD